MRWISITSERSFRRPEEVEGNWIRLSTFCRSLARGCVERSFDSGSTDMVSVSSLVALLASDDRLFLVETCFLFAGGFTHSGIGWSRSNWRRSRLVYSLPLITSSDSKFLSLRKRGTEASDTVMRSSSLSTHAAEFSFEDSPLSSEVLVWSKSS